MKLTEYNVAKNYIYTTVSKVFLILVPLIITPLIFSNLGVIDTGFYFYCTQLASTFLLIDAGISSALSRLIPRIRLKNDHSVQNLLSTSFWLLTILAVFAVLVFFACFDFLISGIDIPDGRHTIYSLSLSFSVLLSIAMIPLRVGYGFMVSKHELHKTQKWEMVASIFKIFLFLIFAFIDSLTLIICLVIIVGIQFLTTLIIFLKSLGNDSIMNVYSLKNFDHTLLQDIWSLSFASLGLTAATIFIFQGSVIAITYLLGLEATAIFGVCLFIYRSLTPFFQILPTLMNPIAAERSVLKTDLYLEQFYYRGIGISASLVFLAVIGSSFFLPKLISIWLAGSEFSDYKLNIISIGITILLLGCAFSLPATFGRSIAFGQGLHKQAMWIELKSSVVIAMLVVLTLSLFETILVAFIVIAIGLAFRGVFLYPKLLSKIFNNNALGIVRDSLYRIMLLAAPFFITIIIYQLLVFPSGYMLIDFASPILVCFLWIIIVYQFLLTTDERAYLGDRLDDFKNRISRP